jgi:gliding motility-associated-like protein
MNLKTRILAVAMLFAGIGAFAQSDDAMPTINPGMDYVDDSGSQQENETSISGQAPLEVTFKANAQNVGNYTASYEWRFTEENGTEPYLIRYEENTQYTFKKAGTHRIVLYATFKRGNDVVEYTQEYWNENTPLSITISESKLEMPNAFSPNGDDYNEIYKAKSGYQSLVEFHAYIFNRWGQKLFEWTDPADGWDGTYKGRKMPTGVYYCLVKAKGADGKLYNIKRDVNLIRDFNETTTNGSTE